MHTNISRYPPLVAGMLLRVVLIVGSDDLQHERYIGSLVTRSEVTRSRGHEVTTPHLRGCDEEYGETGGDLS